MIVPNYQQYGGAPTTAPPSTTKALALKVAPAYGAYPGNTAGSSGGSDSDDGLPGSPSYPSNFVNNLEQPGYKHYPLPLRYDTGSPTPRTTQPPPSTAVMVSALVQPTDASGSTGSAPSTATAMLLTPTPKPPTFAPAGTVAIGVTTLPGASQPAPFAIVPTTTNAPPRTAAIALMTLPGASQPASFALVPLLADSSSGGTTPPVTTTPPPTTTPPTTPPPTGGGGGTSTTPPTTTPPITPTPPAAVDVFSRQPSFNPVFHGKPAREAREGKDEQHEEAVTHDALPVSFVVPAGCDAVDLTMGPIEVSPGGHDKDLNHVIQTGKWRVVDGDTGEAIDEVAIAQGQHINVIVPWRTLSKTRLEAGRLRAFVFAHFYAKDITNS